jgi:hypothetical protein
MVFGKGFLFNTSQQIYFFYGGGLLDPTQPPSWRATPCQLSATAYSIYSQLPSISGGHLLYSQPEDASCRGDKGPTYHGDKANSFSLS